MTDPPKIDSKSDLDILLSLSESKILRRKYAFLAYKARGSEIENVKRRFPEWQNKKYGQV